MLELIEQNAELAQQVLFLRFRIDSLRELNRKLMVSSDAWRMLGRRRPSARMRVALCYRRKSALSSASSPTAGEGAGATGDITANTSCISSGGNIHSERRLRPQADAYARLGVGGSASSSCAASESSA